MAGDERSLSDFNEYVRALIDLAESRETHSLQRIQQLQWQIEDEQSRYGELERKVKTLYDLFNELGEVAIGFHDLLIEAQERPDPWFGAMHGQKINDLYMRYTEVVGKRNELLFSEEAL